MTVLVSSVPSGKITDNVALLVESKSVFVESSTTIDVVVADFILPPLLSPAFTGSLIEIIWPHLTKVPDSAVILNWQDSPDFCSLYKNHLPILAAWPLLVQPKLLIVFTTVPYFAIAAVSSTVS